MRRSRRRALPGSTEVAAQSQAAFSTRDLDLLGSLLDPRVRWGGDEETPQTPTPVGTCVRAEVAETLVRDNAVDLGLVLSGPELGPDGERPDRVFQAFRLACGLIVDIRGCRTREEALTVADAPVPSA